MKELIFYLTSFIFITPVFAQTELSISSNILENTFLIKTDTLSGTCFLIEYNNREYIITAKHLFKSNLKNKDSIKIKIYKDEIFQDINTKYNISFDNTIDMAVLSADKKLSNLKTFSLDGNVIIGQDVYFVGFPNFNKNLFRTYSDELGTIPLVKKAIFSGATKINDYILFYLDGHNNPGFSGSPVVCKDLNSKENILMGMVSSYYYEKKQIQNKDMNNIESYIQENSGIIRCFPINIAKEIIENIK